MTYNAALTDRVRRALAHIPNVEERKMFGSIGFKVNGKLVLGVGDHADHVMMVRVGPDAYDEALKYKGANPAIMRGRERTGYVFLQQKAIETDTDLSHWIKLALDFNKKLTSE